MIDPPTTDVPFRLTRLGVVMSADPHAEFEAEGVLNPASGRDRAGRLWLLPRMVATGNVSRIGLAEILVRNGRPVGVRRDGLVLCPDEGWERSNDHAGVEDPRATWIAALEMHVMAYVAFGPLGPRPALAVSEDMRTWRRLGPVHFEHDPRLGVDFNLYTNKDAVFFPEPVPDRDGRPCLALLHRPTWDLGMIVGSGNVFPPPGIEDPRPGIWISYVPVEAVLNDVRALTHVGSHRLVALPEYDFEILKIGAGPPPRRVAEGWLLIHHGASGTLIEGWGPQPDVRYCAGAMLLDAADPAHVVARSAQPMLEPTTPAECIGAVSNVVFPTAIEEIEGVPYVFYGMADSSIGVAALERVGGEG
jgi:predicted GH43/DUF377 family glycosyl hydrolase